MMLCLVVVLPLSGECAAKQPPPPIDPIPIPLWAVPEFNVQAARKDLLRRMRPIRKELESLIEDTEFFMNDKRLALTPAEVERQKAQLLSMRRNLEKLKAIERELVREDPLGVPPLPLAPMPRPKTID